MLMDMQMDMESYDEEGYYDEEMDLNDMDMEGGQVVQYGN